MSKKKRGFRSIIYKNALATALVGLLLILLLFGISPHLFYRLAKNELSSYIAGSVRESSVRLSYVLAKHSPALGLRENEEVLALLSEYYQEDADQDAIAEKLNAKLETQHDGHSDNGSVYSVTYSILVTERGDYFYTSKDYPAYKDEFDSRELAREFLKTDIISHIQPDESGAFSSDLYYCDDDKCYVPVFRLKTGETETDFFCIVGAFLVDGVQCYTAALTPFAHIYNQLHPLYEVGIRDFSLICDGNIIYQSLEDSILPALMEKADFSGAQQYEETIREYDDGIFYYALCSYPSERLFIVANATQEEMVAPYRKFFYLLELLLFVVILIMVFIFCFIFGISMNRLKAMDREMKKVRSGNFDITLNDQGADEIGNIAETINMMVATIKENLESKIALEKTEKEMQYSLMVSSINPHFIYNTLDTVTFLAAMGKCKDIMLVNNALIGMLKNSIKMKHLEIFDSVENEKKVVEQYMIIENYLYSNPIDFQFEMDEEDSALQIPKNIIQPLVENAIKHGLMPNKDQSRSYTKEGRIAVQVKRKNNAVTIAVTDNGVGMAEETKKYYMGDFPAKIDPEHIGLFNMRRRLSYLYQDQVTFRIEEPEGGGTSVIICLLDITCCLEGKERPDLHF